MTARIEGPVARRASASDKHSAQLSQRDLLAPDFRMRLGALERMPKWLLCLPIAIQWIFLGLRYRSLTLPASANPTIPSGGLVGEGKLDYFNGMGHLARAATARYLAISTRCVPSRAELQQMMLDSGLGFPVIVKPDLGLCGFGIRRVADLGELRSYLTAFPKDETVLLQEYLPQDGEAGIFYTRSPDTDRGSIIGLALRYFPRVTGDGAQSLDSLARADPRVRRLLSSPGHEPLSNASQIPAAGQVVRLATIGSTRVGGLYCDGAALITPQLSAAIDAIARDMPQFHFGRFDVRFDSADELAAGRAFTIMEVNGAGSEAIHAWDPEIGLIKGLQIIFAKQRTLFAIGAAMRARGFKPTGVLALARLNRRQRRLIAAYPRSN